jgi:hypothetical protein
VLKVYYDDTPVYNTSFHSGLSEDQRAQLYEGDDVEVLAESEEQETGADGVPVTSYACKIKTKVREGSFIVAALPPEEFLIHADAITTDDAAFTDHWTLKTRSDLVAMGYDKDTVWDIPKATQLDTAESQSRDRGRSANSVAPDASTELVEYHECFIRLDVDGDGEAELLRRQWRNRRRQPQWLNSRLGSVGRRAAVCRHQVRAYPAPLDRAQRSGRDDRHPEHQDRALAAGAQ